MPVRIQELKDVIKKEFQDIPKEVGWVAVCVMQNRAAKLVQVERKAFYGECTRCLRTIMIYWNCFFFLKTIQRKYSCKSRNKWIKLEISKNCQFSNSIFWVSYNCHRHFLCPIWLLDHSLERVYHKVWNEWSNFAENFIFKKLWGWLASVNSSLGHPVYCVDT